MPPGYCNSFHKMPKHKLNITSSWPMPIAADSACPQRSWSTRKALALVPTLPEVNYRLGVLHSDLHAYDKALESFQRELRINPQSADAAYSLGAYYLNYGNDAAKAREYFETTARLNPGHLGAYLELIKIQLGLGKPAEALALAEKAEAVGNDNDELHYLKSRAFNLQGKKDLAEKELKKFQELRSTKSLP